MSRWRPSTPAWPKLLQSFDTGLAVDPKLGGLDLSVRVRGTPAKVQVADLSGTLGPARVSGGFDADLSGAKPVVSGADLAIEVKHPDLAGLLRALAPEAALGKGLGAVDVKARVTGGSDKVRISELAGHIGPVELSGGLGADLSGPQPAVSDIDIAFTLRHPNLAELARAVGADLALGPALGGVDLKGRVTGDAKVFRVSDLAGRLGGFLQAATGARWMVSVSQDQGEPSIADQARTIRIPVHMIETINKLVRTSRQTLHEIGREPTPEELAVKLGMPLEKVRKVLKIAKEPISLETPIGDEEDSHLGDFIEDKNAVLPLDAAIQSNLRETTTRVLASLTPREERVLRMRFGIGMNTDHTLEEVGQQFSVTRERIRQIEAKALRKLKHPSRSRLLRSFLDT